MEISVEAPEIRLGFGQQVTSCHADGSALICGLAVPVLSGAAEEVLLSRGDEARIVRSGAFHALKTADGEIVGGFAALPCAGSAEPVAHRLYSDLLALIGDQSLYRIWNFVPEINAEVAGREQYQSFNMGRCRAFRERYGESAMECRLPAASAVGIGEPVLAIAFLAGRGEVSFFENPRQIPAYRYPEQYGPCSPSFVRGAVVTGADGRRVGYLSGTASICGHATVGVGDLGTQLETTMENIRAILERMDFASALEPDSSIDSFYRVYLRHAEDLEAVRRRFSEIVGPGPAERTVFLQAPICRSALLLEIEGIFGE
jgi:chorismate lyase/3-hydroxybenzoate synthase